MSVTKAISENITSLDAAKLTGTLPAMSGAALTNLPAPIKSANDPTISTNPSTGVGTLWANTTSGEMFACTDATAGANVWINVGSGSGDVPKEFSLQGTENGYTSGGRTPTGVNNIDKFSFATDSNATDVGDLSETKSEISGQSSNMNGYQSGGGAQPRTKIEKFSFLSDGNSTVSASLAVGYGGLTGQSSSTHGYTSGGESNHNDIQKFTFAADNDATDVGDLTMGRHGCSGNSSLTHGYSCAGYTSGVPSGGQQTRIDRFSFSSDGNAADVSDTTVARWNVAGCDSATHAYCSGGYAFPDTNVIDKFSFASESPSSDVGDLTSSRNGSAGTSSTTHGYVAGGTPSNSSNEHIEKFSFASDGNSVDTADLTLARSYAAPHQY